MFGKPLSEYVSFQKVFLGLIAVVGLARLAVSLAGLPNSSAAFLSMNVVAWAGIIYYGIAVYKQRFGVYKHILPLVIIQTLVFQAIAVAGILIAIGGFPNVFSALEFSFNNPNQWTHLLAHLTIGVVAPSLIGWGIGSLVMWITTKVSPRTA